MKSTKLIALGGALVLAGAGLVWWYHNGQIHPSTDDAYLQANILTIAPQVSGRIETVDAQDNSPVRKGDVLFQLDPAPLQAALDIAQANFDLANSSAGAVGSNVLAAEARVNAATAALANAQSAFDRTKGLAAKGDVATAAVDDATNALDQAKAGLAEATAGLKAATDQAGTPGDQNAAVRAALGQLTQAQINLSYATVTAPAAGWVANIGIRPGQVVGAGQALFSLVEDGEWWVDGNFKETDLLRIRPGQPVTVAIDMYPGTNVRGKIASIGAGSGAAFSLLAPQNATGNWVKVTQRFPVRIELDPVKSSAMQLRVGASVTATVDTSGLDTN